MKIHWPNGTRVAPSQVRQVNIRVTKLCHNFGILSEVDAPMNGHEIHDKGWNYLVDITMKLHIDAVDESVEWKKMNEKQPSSEKMGHCELMVFRSSSKAL